MLLCRRPRRARENRRGVAQVRFSLIEDLQGLKCLRENYTRYL
jgi:hypothetical protein